MPFETYGWYAQPNRLVYDGEGKTGTYKYLATLAKYLPVDRDADKSDNSCEVDWSSYFQPDLVSKTVNKLNTYRSGLGDSWLSQTGHTKTSLFWLNDVNENRICSDVRILGYAGATATLSKDFWKGVGDPPCPAGTDWANCEAAGINLPAIK